MGEQIAVPEVLDPASQFYRDALAAVSRSTNVEAVRVRSTLKDRIVVRTKRFELAGGDGVFNRFARSSTKNVIQRF